MNTGPILAAGLTPAWQQILRFHQLTTGEVNRAREVRWLASGKALNVGRALVALGVPAQVLSVAGGAHRQALQADLRQSLPGVRLVSCASTTRVCTTLLDDRTGQVTELVENSGPLTSEELQLFQSAFAEEAARASCVILSGSLPAGAPPDFYAALMRRTEVPVLLDARGPELVSALGHRPFLVKPNREELAATVGYEIKEQADLRRAIAELHAQGAQWILVSDGGNSAILSGEGQCWEATPPTLQVVNPIGSGDCLAAGLAAGWHRGLDMAAAFRFAMAAAASNASHMVPASLVPEEVSRLEDQVRLVRLSSP